MRISDWSSDVCSSDLMQSRCPAVAEAPTSLRNPRGEERRQPRRRLKRAEVGADEAGAAVEFEHQRSGCGRAGDQWIRHDETRGRRRAGRRSEEHTSELQSLMRTSYAGFCLTKTTQHYKAINAS